MNFTDKVVIVTGAGTGIGRELARQLLSEGAYVVLVGRRKEKLAEVIASSRYPEKGMGVPTDISKLRQLRSLVQSVMETHGRIDVLINNAGVGYGGGISDIRPEEVEYLMKVDVVAQIWLTQLVIPHLQRQKEGLIVNVSSLAGLIPIPNQSFYCAAKHGLHGFSRALRRELLGTSIDVLTVYPGGVESELMSEHVKQKMAENDFRMFDMMKADVAANIIVDGMKKRRAAIFVTHPVERQLVRLNHYVPALVDRRMKTMRPKIRNIVTAATEEVRARLALPESE